MEAIESNWIRFLGEHDLMFAKRLILASGSLKDLAATYGVSYPTIRLRLNRLIEKILALEDERIMSEFERVLRSRVAEGALDETTAKVLLESHRRELELQNEKHRLGV